MSVQVVADNTLQWDGEFTKELGVALEKIGLMAEGYAKAMCPVDTGRLRDSITHMVDGGEKAVYIGTNVEYGPFVELGTYRNPGGHPFLRPAVNDHMEQYRSILKSELCE